MLVVGLGNREARRLGGRVGVCWGHPLGHFLRSYDPRGIDYGGLGCALQ